MKSLLITLFVLVNLFSFGFGATDSERTTKNIHLNANSNTSDLVCSEEDYKPKSKKSLESMNTRQLIDELIEFRPGGFRTYEELSDYTISIEKRIRQAGVKALPIVTEYMNNSFNKQSNFACDNSHFSTVQRMTHDIDRFEFRLRGTSEGKLTIEAFERALARLEKPGFTKKDVSSYRTMFLAQLKGTNHKDQHIQDSFWVLYRTDLSETELLEFTNFLIELDPTYPSWSDTDFVKDRSRINKAGNPRQVYLIKKPKRYYEAYLDFMGTKR